MASGSLGGRAHRDPLRELRRGGDAEERRRVVDLTADFLFTIRFDEQGNWKVIKSHQMSTKEVDARNAASARANQAEQ